MEEQLRRDVIPNADTAQQQASTISSTPLLEQQLLTQQTGLQNHMPLPAPPPHQASQGSEGGGPRLHHQMEPSDISPEFVDLHMQTALGIVRRVHERGGILPVYTKDQLQTQECFDATTLIRWKKGVRSKNVNICPLEVAQYLDKEIPNWKDVSHKNIAATALQKAQDIFARYIARGRVLPRDLRNNNIDEESRKQESRDAAKLNYWKLAVKSPNSSHKCPAPVKKYLDENMPGWSDQVRSVNKQPMEFAVEIVGRYVARGHVLPRELKNRKGDSQREQEYRDASKLRNWNKALRGSGTHMCSDELRDFLDTHMPGWRRPKAEKVSLPFQFAKDIVLRVQQRQGALPRELKETRNDPVRIQEYKDACKLNNWKKSLRGIGTHSCPEHIRLFLDEHIPTWRNRSSGSGRKRSRERDDNGAASRGRSRGRPRLSENKVDMESDELLMAVDESVDSIPHVLLGDDNVSLRQHEVENHEVGDVEHDNSLLELANMDEDVEANMQESIMQSDMNVGDSMDGPSQEMDAEEISIVNVLTAQI